MNSLFPKVGCKIAVGLGDGKVPWRSFLAKFPRVALQLWLKCSLH